MRSFSWQELRHIPRRSTSKAKNGVGRTIEQVKTCFHSVSEILAESKVLWDSLGDVLHSFNCQRDSLESPEKRVSTEKLPRLDWHVDTFVGDCFDCEKMKRAQMVPPIVGR